jgi:hypothetical protein
LGWGGGQHFEGRRQASLLTYPNIQTINITFHLTLENDVIFLLQKNIGRLPLLQKLWFSHFQKLWLSSINKKKWILL